MSGLQKLALYKVVEDNLELCGFFNTPEEVQEYLVKIREMIDKQFQHQLQGEYIAIPSLYYNLTRK